ncbi:hypothetical protein [Streptodolium elevatio]
MGRKDLSAGTWGSFGERAARSLAAPTTKGQTDDGTAGEMADRATAAAAPPEPASRAVARVDGPPPPGEDGPWAWVDLPDGAGTVRVRALRWVRSSSGAWALQASMPGWKAMTDWNRGGWEPEPVDEVHIVPGAQVRPIPGQDYTDLPRDADGGLVP